MHLQEIERLEEHRTEEFNRHYEDVGFPFQSLFQIMEKYSIIWNYSRLWNDSKLGIFRLFYLNTVGYKFI